MHEQLEFQFNWKPVSAEGVKLPDAETVAEYVAAESGGSLANLVCESRPEGGHVELLEEIFTAENLEKAIAKVKANKGAPGIDGITVNGLDAYLSVHLPEIQKRIRAGRYKPSPVRRVEIPKPAGGVRLLGIPTVVDRVIQQAVLQVLTPVFDPHFSESSFGFRPKRSAHDAVRQSKRYIGEGFEYVVDIDVEKFFDRVNHDMLMARVARRVKDKAVLKLIRRYLQAGVMLNGICVAGEEGVPQGGPLSPLLANILLDDLDRELEKRGHRFCRYADDCNIFVQSQRSGDRVKESVSRFLREKLKLHVNADKSAVDLARNRKFLGFSYFVKWEKPWIRIAPQSLTRLKDTIRKLTNPVWSISIEERVKNLNRYLTGWIGYYALSDDFYAISTISAWLRHRLRMNLWHQWKLPRTRIRNLIRLGVRRPTAVRTGASSKGDWRLSRTQAVHTGLNNAFFGEIGLVDLLQLRAEIRKNWQTAVYGTVRTVV